ncbi:hypothetical protein [uncultured Thiohalocapsa sp.]|jgi:hypothetical protein|uniref:hypothetical protein n=1 Tax=uncultured Thiohalocapsa sp. TaxID=768990 RepID=UPI0025DC2621|nr:hypothetical protein [uncultured Thiohalocapsa sp.]
MARRRRASTNRPGRDDAADRAQARALLARLAALLRRIEHPRADEVDALRAGFDTDPATAWRTLDGNAWWAGAGSLAAESLVEPTALEPAERTAAMQEFRALLIDLAELLRARGPTNPGLSSWLLAFRNWAASGI